MRNGHCMKTIAQIRWPSTGCCVFLSSGCGDIRYGFTIFRTEEMDLKFIKLSLTWHMRKREFHGYSSKKMIESLRPFFFNTLCDCRIESEWGEDDDVEPLGNLDLDYANGHPGAEEKSSPSINPPSSPTLVGVRFLTSSNTRTHWFKKCIFILISFKLLKIFFFFTWVCQRA